MIRIENWCRLLAIATAGLFAVTGFAAKPPQAQDKSYRVEFLLPISATNPSRDANGVLQPPTTVTVNLKNESPPSMAASNISSFQFSIAGLAVDPAAASQPVCPGASACALVDDTIYVSGISPPIQGQGIFTVTFKVSSCAALGDATIFNVKAYTGQLSGQEFALYTGNDPNFPDARTLSIREPMDATGAPNFLTAPDSVHTTGIACGPIDCSLNATAPAFISAPESSVNCIASPNSAKCVKAFRGIDKNGFCPASLDYAVTNILPTKKRLHFQWDTSNGAAAFAYRVNVDNAGINQFDSEGQPVWQVSWLSTTAGPAFIGAQTCLNADLTIADPVLPMPSAYGKLAAAVKKSDKSIKVTATSTPAIGDPIVIGSERMIVTKITTNTWTVSRPPTADVHFVDDPIMSTPLPLVTADAILPTEPAVYTVGSQAQTCRASKSTYNATADTWSAWFIDIGDPWVRIGGY